MSDVKSTQSPIPGNGSVTQLAKVVMQGQKFAEHPDLSPGAVKMWLIQVRTSLRNIYGPESEAVKLWTTHEGALSKTEAHALIHERLARVTQLLQSLNAAASKALLPHQGQRVFIGHGRSSEWLKLQNFFSQKLGLPCDEFNIEPTAGLQTADRIETMLTSALMAFLVMTAEDRHNDGTLHARENVIHEIGLFQAKLGSKRAIVMLEDGCSRFSNLGGLTTINFPPGDIMARSEEIRGVLVRERLL